MSVISGGTAENGLSAGGSRSGSAGSARLRVALAVGAYIKFFESKGPNTEEAKRLAGL